jgi:hypothetical protein
MPQKKFFKTSLNLNKALKERSMVLTQKEISLVGHDAWQPQAAGQGEGKASEVLRRTPYADGPWSSL